MHRQMNHRLRLVCIFCLLTSHNAIAHAQMLGPADSLIVVDANQAVVGKVFDGTIGGQEAVIISEQDPYLINMRILEHEIHTNFHALFESDDCSGTPVIEAADRVSGQPFLLGRQIETRFNQNTSGGGEPAHHA